MSQLVPSEETPFDLIEEGMDVYDVNGDKIGEVETTFFGGISDDAIEHGGQIADSPAVDASRADSLFENLAEAFHDELPEELAEKLLNEGYVLIDTGVFGSDRFAMPDQIDRVTEDGIYLKVEGDDLLER